MYHISVLGRPSFGGIIAASEQRAATPRASVTNNIRARHLCDVMALNRNASIYVPPPLFVRHLFFSMHDALHQPAPRE